MNATTVSVSMKHRVTLVLGLVAVSTLVGALVGFFAEFLLSLGNFAGIMGVASHPGEPVGIVIMAALGALLGVVAASTIIAESLHVEISDDDVLATWKGASVRVRKDLVHAIHLGTDFVLYSKNGTELARARAVNPLTLRSTLIHHGYPTPTHREQGDGEFTDDVSILAEDERRIAAARENALRAGNTDIAEILRRQLASMGVMARDRQAGRMSVRTEFRRLDPFRSPILKA